MFKRWIAKSVFGASMALATTMSMAVPVSWTDWTAATLTSTSTSATGSMLIGTESVSVGYSGQYASGVVTNGGSGFWGASTTYDGAGNAPPTQDIIQLYTGGLKTITFSQSVHDPLLALVSWNGVTVDFGAPIEVVDSGSGTYGSGTAVLNSTSTGFTGSGEFHGVIRLLGDFTSIAFTDTTEGWHGFTVGTSGLTPPPPTNNAPEPSSMVLLGLGLAGLAALRRRKA